MGSSSWRLDPVSWLDFQSYFTATITMMFATLAQLAILATIWQTGEAKFWKTKFSDCGSILSIADAITGSVTMTAPFNRKTGRHVLGKGKEVEICIEGTLPPNSGLSPPFAGLKNQAHGKLEVAGVTVPVPVEFCSVNYNGCVGATPACGDMKLGDKVKLCSSLTVPTESPDVDVEVTWKVLVDNQYEDKCETEYDVNTLKGRGKLPLVCINIPARVQPPRRG